MQTLGIKNIDYCTDLLVEICRHWWFKTGLSIVMFIFTFFFDPLHTKMLLALFILILVDFATGIFASIQEKQKIQSHKVARSAMSGT